MVRIIIRIRTPNGVSRIETDDNEAFRDLQAQIAERTGIPVQGQVGVPARVVALESYDEWTRHSQ